MENISRYILFALFICLSACSEEVNIDNDIKRLPQIDIGLSKNQIVALHGQASEISNEIKSSGNIWGPEESFWHKIPQGAKLEIWHYKDNQATLNLYFINDSEILEYKAIHHQDIVY